MNRTTLPIHFLDLPKPPLGNKIFCLQEHGTYVLEQGPTCIRAIMCTHAGAGSVSILDGIPDKDGFCPEENLRPGMEGYERANGRLIWLASPSVMGMWMADGGCFHGVTIVVNGTNPVAAPTIVATWMPYTPPVRRIINDDRPTENKSR